VIGALSTWIAWGTREVAALLRSVAEMVDGLADGLDGGRPRAVAAPSSFDDSPPLSGTRERIAVTLDRARQRYDAVSAAPKDGRRRSK
jgi:hypothetical protein